MSSLIETLVIGGIIWIWVCTFFAGRPWWFFAAYVVSLALTYIFGGYPITGPVELWYLFVGVVLVALTGLSAWIILTALSVRLADYGVLFTINPRSISYISGFTTIVAAASILFFSLLIIIYEFIAWMGIGWEIMIGIFIVIGILVAWFLIYRSKIYKKSEAHAKRFTFWSLSACALGVLLIFLCLLFRLVAWPYSMPDIWVMGIAVAVLVVFAAITLLIMLILHYMDKERKREPKNII